MLEDRNVLLAVGGYQWTNRPDIEIVSFNNNGSSKNSKQLQLESSLEAAIYLPEVEKALFCNNLHHDDLAVTACQTYHPKKGQR